MLTELEWDRSTLAAPFSLYVLMYTGLSFFAGKLTDRLGPRVVIAIGALGLGSGYMSMSTIEEVWEPYLYFAMASIGGAVAFVPCNATVIRWFVRRRGFALGLGGPRDVYLLGAHCVFGLQLGWLSSCRLST